MKEKLKNIGSYVLGIGMFILCLFWVFLMLNGAVWVGAYALQWIANFSWIVFAINLFILLPLALFKKTGVVGGIGMAMSSWVFGLSLFFLGLLVTYSAFGFVVLLIIVIVFGGIVVRSNSILTRVMVVVPFAMLVTIVNGDFLSLFVLVILTVLTFVTSTLGIYLAGKAVKHKDIKTYS